MAVERTGSLTEFRAGTGNTGSTSITVPADAEVIVIGVHGYYSGGIFTGGSISIGGTPCPIEVNADASSSYFEGAAFALDVRTLTGTQTLAWDWQGTEVITNAARMVYGFYKGVDTDSPVRDSDGVQAGSPTFTTPTLTASSGDLIVAWAFAYDSADETGSSSWTNATAIFDYGTQYSSAVASWGEGSPGGDTTVGWAGWTGVEDGGICALVLKPSAAATGQPTMRRWAHVPGMGRSF